MDNRKEKKKEQINEKEKIIIKYSFFGLIEGRIKRRSSGFYCEGVEVRIGLKSENWRFSRLIIDKATHPNQLKQ